MEALGNQSVEVDKDDCNALILPEKKRNKKEKKDQVCKKLKPLANPKLSRSQKRKLKKLEEEKEKAILLSESIKTVEKYKIRDDVYSLMWSSRNLGQDETVREKRQRGVQYSKAGLQLLHGDQTYKRRTTDSTTYKVGHDSDRDESSQEVNAFESAQGRTGDDQMPVEELATENIELALPECPKLSLSTHSLDGEKTRKSKGSIDGNESIWSNSPPKRALSDPTVVNVSRVEENENQGTSLITNGILSNSLQEKALTAPIVVHVCRPEDVENQRRDLPIVMMEQEIMEAINENMSDNLW